MIRKPSFSTHGDERVLNYSHEEVREAKTGKKWPEITKTVQVKDLRILEIEFLIENWIVFIIFTFLETI